LKSETITSDDRQIPQTGTGMFESKIKIRELNMEIRLDGIKEEKPDHRKDFEKPKYSSQR